MLLRPPVWGNARHLRGGAHILEAYQRVTFEDVPSIVYLGVEVRHHGQLPVRQAGLEFDFGATAPAAYLLPPEFRDRDDEHEMRLIDQDRLRTSMRRLAKVTLRLPLRLRGFVQLGTGDKLAVRLTSPLEMPIWRTRDHRGQPTVAAAPLGTTGTLGDDRRVDDGGAAVMSIVDRGDRGDRGDRADQRALFR
ncbi:hypothetical protein CF165_45900 [Amycolatopsis vastitatis]|uniref:Uncharacterized protein n=1 Tax=Amycolatopsis vastitatis TaxID=1905142 RepID=A0A229SLG2_9PSEU|nr:hypothetical protein CF165_45900 [Amycolatopsis vastitatis]